jgi:chaperonin GroES
MKTAVSTSVTRGEAVVRQPSPVFRCFVRDILGDGAAKDRSARSPREPANAGHPFIRIVGKSAREILVAKGSAAKKTERVRPLADRVLVQRFEDEETKVGGIIVPDTAKEKPLRAKVIATGPGRRTDDGGLVKPEVTAGDRILIGKYAGNDIEMDGEEFLILREDEILGILE